MEVLGKGIRRREKVKVNNGVVATDRSAGACPVRQGCEPKAWQHHTSCVLCPLLRAPYVVKRIRMGGGGGGEMALRASPEAAKRGMGALFRRHCQDREAGVWQYLKSTRPSAYAGRRPCAGLSAQHSMRKARKKLALESLCVSLPSMA